MNIFLMTETQSGCYRWRGAIPAKYLFRRGHTVQILAGQSQAVEAPDAIIFYRAHFPQGLKILEWCKRNRIRVVFDTDDALELVPPENLNYKAIQSRLEIYELLLKHADVVTTTTETLAAHLRSWNPNVVVIPKRGSRSRRSRALSAYIARGATMWLPLSQRARSAPLIAAIPLAVAAAASAPSSAASFSSSASTVGFPQRP